MSDHLLERLEIYYDAAPRRAARVEEVGPFTLFVREGRGWPWYGRPRLAEQRFTVDDVEALRARQRELGQVEALEWVHDTTPELLEPARAGGYEVLEAPLLVLGERMDAWAPDGIEIRALRDDELGAGRAVAMVAFGAPGTARGEQGPASAEAMREAAERSAVSDPLMIGFGAFEQGRLVAVGSHTAIGGVTEVTGVGTLPAARRRGIGAAVTAALVADAQAKGVETVFISAGSDVIARVYEKIGFERVGTACIGEVAGGAG
jgi:ribosomal protein S18 acetylase RimI-like enzyme